jgi:hypothetical protein
MTTGAPAQNMPKGPLFLRYATDWKKTKIHVQYKICFGSYHSYVSFAVSTTFGCKENVNKHSTNIFQPLAVISDFVYNTPITSYTSKDISLNHCIFSINSLQSSHGRVFGRVNTKFI